MNISSKGAFQTNHGAKNSSTTNSDLRDNIRPKLNFAEQVLAMDLKSTENVVSDKSHKGKSGKL